MVEVKSDENAVWWTGPMNIDADGAPNAYGPNGGLDYLASAGEAGNWFGLITDQHGEPVVQGPQDPCPGMYLSATALQDHSKDVNDPHRYVDSCSVAYISVPGNAKAEQGIHLGDVALVVCKQTGRASAAIVADIGPKNKWGEGSIALAKALGIPESPKNGGTDHGVTYIVFKGSGAGWPRLNSEIAKQVQDIINALGSYEQYLE